MYAFLTQLLHENVNVCQRQFNILSSLDHKNIIKLSDNFIHKGNDCIIFEYFEKDLLKFIKNSKLILNEKVLAIIIKEILDGIEYLHYKGVIHRDLKPENILVNKKGELVIADFDLARYLNGESMSKGVATIYYRPPEIFYGSTNYSFSLDIWSLGCLIVELILKEPIFKGKSEFEVMYKIYEVLSSANVIIFIILRKKFGLAVLNFQLSLLSEMRNLQGLSIK
jgi:serine/threonine protein kinase